jgi:hypothetical protein
MDRHSLLFAGGVGKGKGETSGRREDGLFTTTILEGTWAVMAASGCHGAVVNSRLHGSHCIMGMI